VLLNGSPGRWINCKRGLRQGDPLSLYLFIIVADVLRRLLHLHPLAADISHPVVPNAPCVVLQYADDTLIFLRSSKDAVAAKKNSCNSLKLPRALPSTITKQLSFPSMLLQLKLRPWPTPSVQPHPLSLRHTLDSLSAPIKSQSLIAYP
jgi:hypothetical protein